MSKQKELEAALSSVIAQLYELNPGLVPFYTNQAGNILAQWGSIQGDIQAQTDLMNLINQIQEEIDSISGGGSAYVLPTASTSTLGGVKIDGTSITIQDGTISADIPTNTSDLTNDSGFITNSVNNLTNYTLSTNLATVATSGSYDDLADKPTIVTSYNDLTDKPSIPEAYTLPTASTTTLGGVKVDGTTVTISGGVISAPAAGVATTTTAGIVKPDDVTIGIEEDGTLVNNSAGCNCYIYGVNGIGSDDITIAADDTTTISTGRLRNFNEANGDRPKVGDVLIDVKGNVAKIDRVNTASADPDAWLFGVSESSVLIKLQLREDENLTTTAKDIVGAINELATRIAALESPTT